MPLFRKKKSIRIITFMYFLTPHKWLSVFRDGFNVAENNLFSQRKLVLLLIILVQVKNKINKDDINIK